MRRGLTALACTLAAATLAADAASAATRRAPCAEGASRPRCVFTDARVSFIADGDTIRVRLGGRIRTVRFTGINAMELTRYSKYPSRRRGACHGLEATAFVERAIRRSGGRVRLAAQRLSSRANRRLRRSVWVRKGGRWRDLSKLELQAGLALWLPNHVENAHNREYLRLAERAAAARKGLYDPSACGAGPDEDLPVSVTVNWDADGNDSQNLDGEWVDIHNGGGRDLALGGWWVRDSFLRIGKGGVPGYRLPASAVVPAGRTLRVRVGCGPAGALELRWCLQRVRVRERRPPATPPRATAPTCSIRRATCARGRSTRAWSPASIRWPGRCGSTSIRRRHESISIANAGGGPIDLGGHLVKLHHAGRPDAFVFGYPFAPGTEMGPGETMRCSAAARPSSDTRLEPPPRPRSLRARRRRGAVSLRTTDDL